MKVKTPGGSLDATARDFSSGQKVFRRYTLTRILGRGGMGVVWLARDDELERDVALKFLPELIILDRAFLADLKRETKRCLELTHKNIVRIYDFVNDETAGCISMEYMDGDTLSNIRADREKKVFESHELPHWMKQLCEALDYAHNHVRVVHRDLKPSNLMLNQRGDLKVADFGIARSLGDSMSMLTMGGARGTSGTLVYMSPQQLDGERGSHLDDIYSLGATLYELLTSKPPFYSGNIDRQIHERIPPSMNNRREELEIVGEPIEQHWEELVAACLQKDPARRPQSALEIAARLAAPSLQRTRWFSTVRKARPVTEPTLARTVPMRPKRESKHRLRRAGTALGQVGHGVLRGVAFAAAFVVRDFRDSGLILANIGQAVVRSTAIALSAVAKVFGDAGLTLAAAIKAIGRGMAVVIATITRGFGNLGLALIAALKTLGKEAARGTAITLIPAGLVALCIWFFAVRTPPPQKIVKQPVPIQQPPSSKPPPSVALTKPELPKIASIPSPGPQNLAESKPSPPVLGGLAVNTSPAGATVIVDGSIIKTSPSTLSNLTVGKHHLQIVLPEYKTEEMDIDVKGSEVVSSGLITLHPMPRVTAPPANEVGATSAAHKETEQKKISPAKKSPRKQQVAVSQPEKSPPSAARQVAATTTTSKNVPKSAATPKPAPTRSRAPTTQEKPVLPFQGTAPGG